MSKKVFQNTLRAFIYTSDWLRVNGHEVPDAHDEQILSFSHTVYVFRDSWEQAREVGLREALEMWPIEKGLTAHECSPAEMTREQIVKARDMFDELLSRIEDGEISDDERLM